MLVAFKEYTEKMSVKHFHSEIVLLNYSNNYREIVPNTELNIKFSM